MKTTNPIRPILRNYETVSSMLNRLHGTMGLSWPEIALKTAIPAGTLWDIAHGKPVPKKWKARLGMIQYKDLFSMPVAELLWSIQNRKEIQCG